MMDGRVTKEELEVLLADDDFAKPKKQSRALIALISAILLVLSACFLTGIYYLK